MNVEVHETQIFTIVKTVCAQHRVIAEIKPADGEEVGFNVTIEYFWEPFWRKRKELIKFLAIFSSSHYFATLIGGFFVPHELWEVLLAAIPAIASLFAAIEEERQREDANIHLHSRINVALRQHGYEVVQRDGRKTVRWFAT